MNVVSFIEKSTREKYYHNALDRMLRALRENGIGLERKRAQVITRDIEAKLWETGVLGLHSPQSLLNSVFFYNGKIFYLRGVSEHAKLQFSQIQHCFHPERYVYSEYGSKNRSGGIRDLDEGKVVSIVATSSPYCHVAILNM